jgi:WD40 repeat protein
MKPLALIMVVFCSAPCFSWTPSRPHGGTWGGWTTACVSPSGKWMASASSEGDLALWRSSTGNNEFFQRLPNVFWESVAVSDEGWIVAGGKKGRLVSVSPHEHLRNLSSLSSAVRALSMAPNGFWVAYDGGPLQLCDRQGRVLLSISLPRFTQITALSVSLNGLWLASADETGQISVYSTSNGRLVSHWKATPGRIGTIQALSTGWFLASNDGRLTLWSRHGELLANVPLGGEPLTALTSGSWGWMAGNSQGKVWTGLWDPKGLPQAPERSWKCGAGEVVGLGWAGAFWVSVSSDAGLRAWSWPSGNLHGEILPQ